MADVKLPGNSISERNAQQEQPQSRVEAPVTTNIKVKKENSLAKKFFAQDLKSTAKGVNNDIVIPGIKNLIITTLKRAIDYLFLGSYGSSNGGFGTTNYSSFSNTTNFAKGITYGSGYQQPMTTAALNRQSSIYAINEIVFMDRGEAEEVLTRMNEIILKYGMVSVLDFYDLVGRKGVDTDNNYGWRNLSSAQVNRGFDGYRILFPRIEPLS